jgi:hypothetical protein
MRQGLILLSRCLKIGMNPELVDASIRLKNIKKSKTKDDKPVLIDNLEPLESSGIVSDVLKVIIKPLFHNYSYCCPFQDILTESPKDIFLPVPSYTTLVGDFGDEQVFLLQDGNLSEQDYIYNNFSISPNSSLYSQTDSSPTSSDNSYEIFQKDTSVCDEFSYIVTNTGDVQTGFDICMDDTMNFPESIYPVEVQEKEPVFTNNQTSVIVKSKGGEIFNCEPSDFTQYVQNAPTTNIMINNFHMQENTFENKNVHNMKNTSDDEVTYGMKDNEEEMREGFDIESLVEECFSQEGVEKHDI